MSLKVDTLHGYQLDSLPHAGQPGGGWVGAGLLPARFGDTGSLCRDGRGWAMNKHNFVAPLPVNERRQPANIDVSPYMGGEVIHVGEPLAVQDGATEKTSGMDRSKAWVVRLIPYTMINLILSITLVSLAGGGWVLAFCLFAASSLFAYAVLDGREHKYSRNGLERHKVDTLAELKFDEHDKTHELRKMALKAQIEMWRGVNYHDERRTTYTGSRTIEGRATTQATHYLTVGADTQADED